jgi:hypothetical protein
MKRRRFTSHYKVYTCEFRRLDQALTRKIGFRKNHDDQVLTGPPIRRMDFSLKWCRILLSLFIPDAFFFIKNSILGFGGHHACGVGRIFRPRAYCLAKVDPTAWPTRNNSIVFQRQAARP